MGQTGNRKIVAVVGLFLFTSILVYGKPEPVRSLKSISLNKALLEVDGWETGPHIPYARDVVDSLALDDYVNRVFVKDQKTVSLYIGYYLTTGKVGAAHDPLVCFPGQGWDVSDREKGEIEILYGGGRKVSYSTMTVERDGGDKQIILYWFQAYEIANANTFNQKITALFQRISGAGEDNAFVRLTCSTAQQSESECIETMQSFTKSFYPIFLDYIRQ